MPLVTPSSNSTKNGQLTVDQLLAVARAQGGSVAEVAEELSNPRRSMLATMGNGFKNAFTGFVDIITAPNQIVAGMISPDYTVKEALEKNIAVSDVVFKNKTPENAGFGEKALDFTARFAVDVLADPLTYVTFGASRGIVGLSSLPKTFAGEKTAQLLGLKQAGNKIFLNETGEQLAQDYLKFVQSGNRSGFFTSKRLDLLDDLKKTGDDGLTEAYRAIREFDEEISESLSKQILTNRLSKTDAINAVGKLIEKHPALIETLLDKGGIKFFGKSILSSQRIRGTIAAVPGMTTLDRLTQPMRNATGALFSSNYKLDKSVQGGGGRLSDEAIRVTQKYRDLADSMGNTLLNDATRVFKTLGINKNESEFITAAIESGLSPRDPRLGDIWTKLNGIDGGVSDIRPEVWQAMNFTSNRLKKNLNLLREAGMQVSDLPNYFPHILVKEQVNKIGFNPTGKTVANSSKYAKISTLVDDAGERYPIAFDAKPDMDGNVVGRIIKDGKEEKRTFKVINTDKEIAKIEKIAKARERDIVKELNKLQTERKALGAGVKTDLSREVTKQIIKSMEDVKGLDNNDAKAIASVVESYIKNSNLEQIISSRLKRAFKGGVKLKSGTNISEEKLADILSELDMQKMMAPSQAKHTLSMVNKALAKDIKLKHVSAEKIRVGEILDKDSRELIEKLKAEIADINKSVIEKGIDKKGLQSVLDQVVARTAKNPGALRSVLDKLIKDKQLADDLFEELSDVQRGFEIEEAKLIEQGGKFIDKVSGKAYERARATVKEAQDLGTEFSDNALVGMLLGSMEAIKVSTTRNFMREIAEKMGKRASEAPEGYRAVEKTGLRFEGDDIARQIKNQKGEELYFHPLVAKHIEEFAGSLAADEATETIMRNYDKLQNLFKASVTSIFPAFHGRNAISNVLLNYLDIGLHALDPVQNLRTARMLHMNSKMGRLQEKMLKEASAEATQKGIVKEGGKLTPEQSLLQSAKGKTLDEFVESLGTPVYHGSRGTIKSTDDFSYEMIGTGGKNQGYGFYFTDNKQQAQGYMRDRALVNGEWEVKDYVSDQASLLEAYPVFKKPLIIKRNDPRNVGDIFTREQFKKIALAGDKVGDKNKGGHWSIKYDKATELGRKYPQKTQKELNEMSANASLDELLDSAYDSIKNQPSSGSWNGAYVFQDKLKPFWSDKEKFLKSFVNETGYDGVIDSSARSYNLSDNQSIQVAFTKDAIKTRSQLKDIWKKANTASKEEGKAMKEYTKLLQEKVFTDSDGYEWSFGELRSVMHENVVAFHPRNLGQIDQVQFGRDNVIEIGEKLFPESKKDVMMNKFRSVNPFSTKNVAVKTGLKVGGLVEDYGRIMNFMSNLQNTGNVIQSAERTKMFLFDYQNLSNFERKYLRRLIPFYTFSRKNMQLQIETLFTKPGRIAQQIRAVQTIGDTFGAESLTDEEREKLPEWMRGGINTVMSREGSHISVLSSIGTPIEQPFQQLQPNQALASVSPILRVGPELMMNYSMFHGKPISQVTNAAAFKSAPAWIKDFIGYTEVKGEDRNGEEFVYYTSLRPKRMHLLLNLPPTSRVISELKGLQKPGTDRSVKALDFLVGFNPYELDIEVEEQRREDEARRELEEVLTQARVGYTINRFVIPDEE